MVAVSRSTRTWSTVRFSVSLAASSDSGDRGGLSLRGSDSCLLAFDCLGLASFLHGRFECEAVFQLQLLGEASVEEADDESITNHFWFQRSVLAVLSEVVQGRDEGFHTLAMLLVPLVEASAFEDRVLLRDEVVFELTEDGRVTFFVVAGKVETGQDIFSVTAHRVDEGVYLYLWLLVAESRGDAVPFEPLLPTRPCVGDFSVERFR